jgi:endonuclease YncB( thermonuclease family)
MAVPGRLELPTFGLGNRCSIRLSYGTVPLCEATADIAQVMPPARPKRRSTAVFPAFGSLPMRRRWDGVFAVAIAAVGGCVSASAQQPAMPPCGGAEFTRGTVSHVIDGNTFALDDGREVRLAAIDVPPLDASTPGGAAAKATLDALVNGDQVVLRRAEFPADRYGRLFAFAYAVRDGEEIFAQGELVSAGFARVADRVGNRSCAAELFGREKAARTEKLGLWADSYYHPLDAESPADVLAYRGHFALVEGRVVSVRESGATIYVNFGRRWSEGFAVTVLKRNERNFNAAGLNLPALEGRRVRVRGWIEVRGAAGSPEITVAHPEQIELADGK